MEKQGQYPVIFLTLKETKGEMHKIPLMTTKGTINVLFILAPLPIKGAYMV